MYEYVIQLSFRSEYDERSWSIRVEKFSSIIHLTKNQFLARLEKTTDYNKIIYEEIKDMWWIAKYPKEVTKEIELRFDSLLKGTYKDMKFHLTIKVS